MPASKHPAVTTYIDPLVDFAFKKIFGSEPNKDLLIAFLNEVLRGRKQISDLTYSKNDHPGDGKEGGAVFDLLCTGADGEHFIIEVQRGSQAYFKDRALFYTSRLISSQAPKGKRNEWKYELPEVYLIALLEDFSLAGNSAGEYIYDICLCNRETGAIFYDKLNYTYIELHKFAKGAKDLKTDLDRWLYVLKNLSVMQKLPAYLRKPIFVKLFQIAAYNNMTKQERLQYDRNLMRKWDNKNVMDYAIEQAVKQAVEKAVEKTIEQKEREEHSKLLKIARAMKKDGLPVSQIVKFTGLTATEVKNL